ncbi:YdaS family helix-turn-helix protein [Pseudomonas sp. C5pp]|uniref:YdaS family helix-turn-helix protein n=1 Tax=Pseudomonas sp. C5pp TaxID=1586081 RepID=UPI0013791F56|nr:YdaS family helix-turn-helix protein [Pseudomonas sp. C5pp]EKT4540172.1 helix-turn-helix domain-containing protein [Pseudomonas putida]
MFAYVTHIVCIGNGMNTPDQVFELILRAAKEAGKTPSQLARECQVSPQRLFNWRRRGVPVAQVRLLSKALSEVLLPHQLRPDLPDVFPAPEAIPTHDAA